MLFCPNRAALSCAAHGSIWRSPATAAFRSRNACEGPMPENDPGGLKKEEYADVLAYILRINAYPAGYDELPTDPEALKKLGIAPNGK